MESDQTALKGNGQLSVTFVKGCPCFRQFGDEKVCLNNDEVLPVNAISVDTAFFEEVSSHIDLEETKSDNESMCYLLILLDRETGHCYCVSQNQRIRIDDEDVSVSDIDSALSFVMNTEKMSDGLLCSECLYKYLRTLGAPSEGYFTTAEREAVVSQYIREIGYQMSSELSGVRIPDPSSVEASKRKALSRYIERVGKSRGKWASVILRLKKSGADKALLDLIENYRSLHRLEAVFLHQVLGLDNPSEYDDAETMIRVMIGIAEKVISLSEHIVVETGRLMAKGIVGGSLSTILQESSEKRKRTEERFRDLSSVLKEITSRSA